MERGSEVIDAPPGMNKVRHEAKFDFLYVRKLQGKRARGGAMGRESEADRWEDVEEVNESGGPLSTPAKPTETRSRMRSHVQPRASVGGSRRKTRMWRIRMQMLVVSPSLDLSQ